MTNWSLTADKDLRQYQWKSIHFGLAQPRNAMFLDMGLGKTTITLHTIKALLHKNLLGGLPVLIVAPIRVIHNVWRQEAAKWQHTAGLRFSILHGSQRRRLAAFNADVDIMLINPENLVWLTNLLTANGYGATSYDYQQDQFKIEANARAKERGEEWEKVVPHKPWPWSMLVIDESSMFKNSSTKRWKVVAHARTLFPRLTLLTGTPTPNTMMELWPQMYFIDGGKRLGFTKTSFRDRYFYKTNYIGYNYRFPCELVLTTIDYIK